MQVKTCPAQIKAAGTHEGTDEGVFEAVVATYDVDSIGDRIMPGAFKDSLDAWRQSGSPIPVIWSHKSDDPEYHIGYVEEAEEREGVGLWVKARVDMDEPKAAKVYKLLKGRRITQFSFSYDELDARPSAKDDSGARKDLHKLKVYEVGPTLIGCNQSTSLLGVKHDQTVEPATPPVGQTNDADTAGKISDTAADLEKAGRALSARNVAALQDALATIQKVLAAASPAESEDDDSTSDSNADKASPEQPAEAPAVEAKSDAPARAGTADERLRTAIELMELEAATYTL